MLLVYCVLTAGKPLVTLTSHLREPVSSDVTLLVCRLTPCPWSCLWYLSVNFPPSLHSRSPYTQHRRQWLFIHATSPPLPLNEITDLYFALAGRHSFDDILCFVPPVLSCVCSVRMRCSCCCDCWRGTSATRHVNKRWLCLLDCMLINTSPQCYFPVESTQAQVFADDTVTFRRAII